MLAPKKKYLWILIPGILFSIYLFYSINDKYLLRNKASIDMATNKVQIKLRNELDKANLALESMSVFFQSSDNISPQLFVDFTTPFVEELNGATVLGWAPRSEYNNLPTAISDRSEYYIDTNGLSKIGVQGSHGNPIYKAKLINPARGNKHLFNINLHAGNLKSATVNALELNRISFSGPMSISCGNQNIHGFVSIFAISDSLKPSSKGVVFGIFDMEVFVKKTLDFELPILDIEIMDLQNSKVPLYSNLDRSRAMEKDEYEVTSFAAADKLWQVTTIPKAHLTDYPHALEAYFAFLLGLSTSFLLATVLTQRDRYGSDLVEAVQLRTHELEKSNQIKENLLREIHHRVKNNLQITSSLINLQKRKLTNTDMIEVLESSQSRILAIALIHQKIYQNEDSKAVNLKSYLQDLIRSHKHISPSISYEIKCPKIFLDLDTAVPIALITSELVVNALKHAFIDDKPSNSLSIYITQLKDRKIHIKIADNGIGMQMPIRPDLKRGLGFEIIHKLCRQIQADFKQSPSSSGTEFNLSFLPKVANSNLLRTA